jgi:hypothetical protein
MEGVRGGGSYAIVQHSLSYMQAVAIGAACSRSGAAVPTGLAENCVTKRNWTQDLGSDTMDPPLLIQP